MVKVLDKGFVELVRYMGDDNSICETARCSTASSGKDNVGLIDYLMRHRHTSPFEFVEFVFHIKCPIFCIRQIIRHRTANVNEKSLRYSKANDDFYIPDINEIRKQDKINRQMANESLGDEIVSKEFCYDVNTLSEEAFEIYMEAIDSGICREQARMVLPVNLYTEFYWKMDLHNLLHFLKLRMDNHAQKEVRLYADAIYEIIKPIIPNTISSFEDHILNSITFSKTESDVLFSLINNFSIENYEKALRERGVVGIRLSECLDKIKNRI